MPVTYRGEPAEVRREAVHGLECEVELPFSAEVPVQALHVGRTDSLRVGQERKEAAEPDSERKLRAARAAHPEIEERAVEPQRAHLLATLALMRVKRAD